ncbi:MAG TPA: NAD(P)/FAD-dependent oxidoreductase [Solirubrobacteraceae bacterium]|nr:NAD(P)/FAD-dependent oxidoreductase [Solirubrobacteraceae bacterium]
MAHKVVVVGGGFGGLRAVQPLRRAPVEVTLIDRRNFHLFQPLTYQVATGALGPSEVAYPLREIFSRSPNVRVMLAEVEDFDLDRRTVKLGESSGVDAPADIAYDTLVVAAGSSYSYFGHEEFARYALEVKTLESAESVRSRLLSAFESAENAELPDELNPDLTFVIVGAGPTGVEMSGQIAELARETLRHDFRRINPKRARVILVDGVDRILTSFPPSLSAKATRSLERLGVDVRLDHMVTDVDATGVTTTTSDGEQQRIDSHNVVWAAGVTASPLAKRLAELSGAAVDKNGRLVTEPDLSLPGHPEVFAIGDMVQVRDHSGEVKPLPGLAPVAIQQGHHVARVIKRRLQDQGSVPFRYHDKGNVATIGKGRAIVDVHGLRLSGLPAWMIWLVVHIWYLVGFRNRVLVLLQWSISFFTSGRGSRLIEAIPATDTASAVPPAE